MFETVNVLTWQSSESAWRLPAAQTLMFWFWFWHLALLSAFYHKQLVLIYQEPSDYTLIFLTFHLRHIKMQRKFREFGQLLTFLRGSRYTPPPLLPKNLYHVCCTLRIWYFNIYIEIFIMQLRAIIFQT